MQKRYWSRNRRGGCAETELGELFRRKKCDGGDRSSREHDNESGDDAADTSFVEPREGKTSQLQFTDDDRSNQISGDDEENINADKSAAKSPKIKVKENDGQNREARKPSRSGR